jgi:hypothetical protein
MVEPMSTDAEVGDTVTWVTPVGEGPGPGFLSPPPQLAVSNSAVPIPAHRLARRLLTAIDPSCASPESVMRVFRITCGSPDAIDDRRWRRMSARADATERSSCLTLRD